MSRSAIPGVAGTRRIGRTTLTRLVAYYVGTGILIYGLGRLVARLPPGMGPGEGQFPGWADAAFQMASALALVIPMALVYVRTRTLQKYDQSLVQTVIVLPLTVTAVLIVVQNSLALAFSLAGIVAAVRFRNNLRESRDAVYILGSLGIGFAMGVHQAEIALVLSILFCGVELVLWRLDIGADHATVLCRFCGTDAVEQVEKGAPAAAAPDGKGGGTPARGRDLRIRVFVAEPGPGRRAVEPVLEEVVKRWRFIAGGEGDGRRYLDYEVHLKKRGSADALGAELRHRGAGDVLGLDLQPVAAGASSAD